MMKKMIKKLSLAAVLGLTVMTGTACTKILPKNLNFNMDGAEFTITLPAQSATGDLTFTEQNADVNVDSALRANTAEIYALKSVKLTSVELTVDSPDGQTFDPIDNVSTYVSGQGLSEQRVAYKDPMPKGQNTVKLDIDDLELAPYLKQDHAQYRISGHLSQPTTETVKVRVRTTYHVEAEKEQ